MPKVAHKASAAAESRLDGESAKRMAEDVSPNVNGSFCTNTGVSCENQYSAPVLANTVEQLFGAMVSFLSCQCGDSGRHGKELGGRISESVSADARVFEACVLQRLLDQDFHRM